MTEWYVAFRAVGDFFASLHSHCWQSALWYFGLCDSLIPGYLNLCVFTYDVLSPPPQILNKLNYFDRFY